MRARARRIADSGDPRVTEVRALQDDDPDIAVPDGNAAIVENRQDGPFEMRRHQLLTVRRQVGAFLATSLVFGVVAACAAEPKVYSLELEGYETLMQAFLPEEERAIETLIAIPSRSSLAGNFWDDVTLCFSTEESALQYHAALMGRSECPRASDFEISGHLVRRGRLFTWTFYLERSDRRYGGPGKREMANKRQFCKSTSDGITGVQLWEG